MRPQLEKLDRGLVAVKTPDGVYLSWRMLREEVRGAEKDRLIGADFIVLRNGEAIATDWTGTIATGSVVLTDVNEAAAAAGTVEAIADVKAKLEKGEIKVFDTAADAFITVGGAKLESYMADVDTDAAFAKDTEVVFDGFFHESEFRSAPYFDVQLDGIELLNAKY